MKGLMCQTMESRLYPEGTERDSKVYNQESEDILFLLDQFGCRVEKRRRIGSSQPSLKM